MNERLNKLMDRWYAGEFETHEDQADAGSTLVDLLSSELDRVRGVLKRVNVLMESGFYQQAGAALAEEAANMEPKP